MISTICVIDNCNVDKESPKYVVLTLYGEKRGEMHISSIKKVDNLKSPLLARVSRFLFLHGVGDAFNMPDTRLRVNATDMFNEKLNSYVERSYTFGRYQMGKLEGLERKDPVYVMSVNKITSNNGIVSFTPLSAEERKEFNDRRKKNVIPKESEKKGKKKIEKLKEKKSKVDELVDAISRIRVPDTTKDLLELESVGASRVGNDDARSIAGSVVSLKSNVSSAKVQPIEIVDFFSKFYDQLTIYNEDEVFSGLSFPKFKEYHGTLILKRYSFGLILEGTVVVCIRVDQESHTRFRVSGRIVVPRDVQGLVFDDDQMSVVFFNM